MIKLNLGCGNDIKEGYINIDVRKTHPSVIIANVINLPYENNSVDEIIAKDVFEHISYHQSKKVLKHWIDKLKKGGTLYIKCPSIDMIARQIIENSDNIDIIEDMIKRIFGGQNYIENIHMTSGHPLIFKKYLLELGVKDEHIKIQDGGFGNGTNMNIWVIK